MNPDLLTDGGTDFGLDALDEAHAHSLEFIRWTDRGCNFQRGLFHSASAQVRRGIYAFECDWRFSCFHIFYFWFRR